MNKIDEIALRVASEIGAVSYSPPPFRAVRGYSFTYDDLWRFTRALVADPELLAELRKATSPVIASEQKPVGEGYIRDGKIIAVKLKDVELVMRLPEGVTLESLYLHPSPIPEGYVLVPIDPEGQWSNDDLINIMVDAYQDCNGGYYDSMLAAYKALLAAARSE